MPSRGCPPWVPAVRYLTNCVNLHALYGHQVAIPSAALERYVWEKLWSEAWMTSSCKLVGQHDSAIDQIPYVYVDAQQRESPNYPAFGVHVK